MFTANLEVIWEMVGHKDNAMDKENGPGRDEAEKDRREFLKRVGTAAAVAPAVALLLSAGSKPATAGEIGYGA